MRPKAREIGSDVQREAVEADPAAHPDADGTDLCLAAVTEVDPDADVARAEPGLDADRRQRGDQPGFQPLDEDTDIGSAASEVEHHVANPLPRPVIGDAAAAAGPVDGEARRSSSSSSRALVPQV